MTMTLPTLCNNYAHKMDEQTQVCHPGSYLFILRNVILSSTLPSVVTAHVAISSCLVLIEGIIHIPAES